ncbi:MAG: hypothetical protein JKX88_10760, partial [Marinicaulis sp.]|nr:hypothetical protein [Marinicaulis sp.]
RYRARRHLREAAGRDPVETNVEHFAAGLIAQATAGVGEEGQNVVLDVYSNVGWLAIWVGIGLIIISPAINYLMHLSTLKDDEHPLAGEAQLGQPGAGGVHPAEKTKS